jgi:hypothetical protein
MNPRLHSIPRQQKRLAAALLGLALVLQAAPTQAGASAQAPETAVSPSVFVMPNTPQDGRDPFFPRSMRPYAHPIIPTNAPVIIADLRLNGISGSAERRLAIINNRTFGVGEEGEVPSGSERVRIRCLEIKGDAVVIQFVSGGARRELKLRRGV